MGIECASKGDEVRKAKQRGEKTREGGEKEKLPRPDFLQGEKNQQFFTSSQCPKVGLAFSEHFLQIKSLHHVRWAGNEDGACQATPSFLNIILVSGPVQMQGSNKMEKGHSDYFVRTGKVSETSKSFKKCSILGKMSEVGLFKDLFVPTYTSCARTPQKHK